MHMRLSSLVTCVALAAIAPVASAQTRPALGETVTTASGLQYKFVKLGKGAKPATGDLMIMHGVGTLTNGKEFWNTRTNNEPFEYLLGIDSVIKGFAEGMREVRAGDRVIMTMTANLAYGERGSGADIPPNSTLVFDYEILDVKPLSIVKVLIDGFAAGTTDEAIAKAKALPNLKAHYVSATTIWSAARRAERKNAGDGEKVYAFGITLMPKAYELWQGLAVAQAKRGAVADAITSYESAVKLNPKKTADQKSEAEDATKALAELRKK